MPFLFCILRFGMKGLVLILFTYYYDCFYLRLT